ncbi:hypothetical protein SAMN05192541_15021 [Bradyrhizobium arachidis]|nr:hypothetical protein SAMN05192541_15021 [Bradyrhizobium arachidis]
MKAGIAVQRIEIDRQGNIVVCAGQPIGQGELGNVNEWDWVQ